MERVVVGIDGSDNSRVALEWAAAEARAQHQELVIVHAWMLPAAAHGSLVVPNFHPVATKKAYRDAAQATANVLVAKVDLTDVAHEVRVVEGSPGPSLIDASHDATKVVVGHRGRRRLAQLVLGSTAKYVSRHSPVPVVVVPDRARTLAPAA